MADQLERCWPWLHAAAERGPQCGLTKDQLAERLARNAVQLWPGDYGAMLTELVQDQGGLWLHVWLGGGLLGSLLAMRPGVEAWGRAQGADFVSIQGRKGWDRVLRPLGYRRVGGEVRKAL